MGTMLSDLRFSFRLLLGRPGFTGIAVFTLALGISVTTAMFSVLDTMYWKAFPGAAEPSRLVELETIAPDGSMVRGSWRDFREYRERLSPIAAVAAHDDTTFTVGLAERARPVSGELVSGNYFAVLGVSAALGRVFSAEEYTDVPGAHPVAVISHRLWTRDFEASGGVLGRTIRVNRHNLTIIGVMPKAFRGAMAGVQGDLWVPFTMGLELGAIEKETFLDASLRNVYMFARLARGRGIGGARAELAALSQRIAVLEPKGHKGFGATFEPMWRARVNGRAAFLQPMLILMAVSLLILAIVCANVANLLLARSVGRLREFAVRCAMGASPWRLARQCFTETLMLASAGALAGVPLALWMTDSASLLLPRMARGDTIPIEMDWRILGFACLMCLVAAFASSAAAVFFVLRSDVNATLREGGRTGSEGTRSHRLRGALVISEVALALVVLIGAGLFFRSYRNVNAIDPGFDRTGVLLANFPLASGGYSVEELESFCLRLRDRLEPAPGIAAVTYADYAPLWSTDGPYTAAQPEGFVPRNPEDLKVHRTTIAPGYFALLKIPVLEGRDFNENDDGKARRVMIVDQAFARRFYGGASPVGRRVEVWGEWYTVVGLVRYSKYFSFTEGSRPHYYLAFRQSYQMGQHIVFFVRAKGDPDAAIANLRSAAVAIDPNAASFTAAPLVEYNALLLFPLKLAASLLAALGVIAFLLAGVGLYGVISYAVSQRTRELGIRMALGAKPRQVLGAVVRQGMLLTAAGVTLGLALALASMRLLTSLLVGVSPFDPLTFVAASVFLASVAALASFLPAHRATRIEPYAALHGG
jgi:predicted permease